jgi:uncharacterized phage infection (PIP) family protein YhgE
MVSTVSSMASTAVDDGPGYSWMETIALRFLEATALIALITAVATAVLVQYQLMAAAILLALTAGLGSYYFKPIISISQAIDQIEIERKKFDDTLSEGKEANSSLASELHQLDQTTGTIKNNLVNDLRGTIKEKKELGEELNQVKQSLTQIDPEVEKLKELQKDAEGQISRFSLENGQLQKQVSTLTGEIEKLRLSESQLQQEVKELKTSLESGIAEREKMSKSSEDQRTNITRLEENIAKLEKGREAFIQSLKGAGSTHSTSNGTPSSENIKLQQQIDKFLHDQGNK